MGAGAPVYGNQEWDSKELSEQYGRMYLAYCVTGHGVWPPKGFESDRGVTLSDDGGFLGLTSWDHTVSHTLKSSESLR